MYDLIILGAGPAGVSAAIYAGRAKLNTLWIDRKYEVGGQILDTYEIDNYPGITGVSGVELAEKMAEHAEKLGISLKRDYVRSIEKQEGIFVLRSKKNVYEARSVILAGGVSHRHLEIPGEEELSGMGVSYCATCDGAFFKDRVTAVIGGGNTAVEDAVFLSRLCKKVYLVHRRSELRADAILQERLRECENVEILWSYVPVEILGSDQVSGLKIRSAVDETEQILPVDGVFVAVGVVPNTEGYREFVKLDENGYIQAGEDCITNVTGFFAAGDIRTKKLRQVVTAVADGANAVSSVQEYLLYSGK